MRDRVLRIRAWNPCPSAEITLGLKGEINCVRKFCGPTLHNSVGRRGGAASLGQVHLNSSIPRQCKFDMPQVGKHWRETVRHCWDLGEQRQSDETTDRVGFTAFGGPNVGST